MAWELNIHKIVQSSLYSWTMYKIKQSKVLPSYDSSSATSWHSSSYFNLAILYVFIFGNSWINLLKSLFNL